MHADDTHLDNDELFHLALKAMEHGETESALLHLKRLLENDPENGRAHYLLGALHAEIGMYARAIEDMRRAVALEPELPTAHFQLGLLYAADGRPAEAETAWSQLDPLGEDEPLCLFKRGLMHLIRDEFEACHADLTKGIQYNDANPALNTDMQQILNTVNQLLQPNPEATTDPAKLDGRSLLLNAYQRNEYDNDTEH